MIAYDKLDKINNYIIYMNGTLSSPNHKPIMLDVISAL